MNKSTKISITKRAKKNFESWNTKGKPEVKDKDGKVFHKSKGEKFLESTLLSKRGANKRYYISNRGHLVCFNHPEKPTLKAVEKREGDRDRYCIQKGNRTIYHGTTYALVAEAFSIYAYGLAKKGEKSEIHHERKYIQRKGLAFNNNPDYLEYVTEEIHDLLTKIQNKPSQERSIKEELEIMQALSYLAGKEEPDNITVVTQEIENPERVKIEAIENEKDSAQFEIAIRAKMCTDYLNTQNLESGIRYAVYTVRNNCYVGSLYEYKPSEKDSVIIPCDQEEFIKQFKASKQFTDDFIRGYLSMFDMLSDT